VQRKNLRLNVGMLIFLSSDEFMGSFKIAVDSIPVKAVTTWYKLGPSRAYKGDVGGEIQIEFTKNV